MQRKDGTKPRAIEWPWYSRAEPAVEGAGIHRVEAEADQRQLRSAGSHHRAWDPRQACLTREALSFGGGSGSQAVSVRMVLANRAQPAQGNEKAIPTQPAPR